jgi:hypothetical protein
MSVWEDGDRIKKSHQAPNIQICLPSQMLLLAKPKLNARFSLLSVDDSTRILILEPMSTGFAELATRKDDIGMLQVLELTQRHARNLSSRLKLLTTTEFQDIPVLRDRREGLNSSLDLWDQEIPCATVQDDVRQQLVTLMQETLRT